MTNSNLPSSAPLCPNLPALPGVPKVSTVPAVPPVMPSRSGFTLVELTVAVTIAAIAVTLAAQIFAAASDSMEALRDVRNELDREMNARRWLGAAFMSMEAGPDQGLLFDGEPDRVSFATWLLTADGWYERERVVLSSDGDNLKANVGASRSIVLSDDVSSVEFDYLLERGEFAPWLSAWRSSLVLPMAVRIRLVRGAGNVSDTLLFVTKERG